jgi:outer membrane lipoprotein-sorting protein
MWKSMFLVFIKTKALKAAFLGLVLTPAVMRAESLAAILARMDRSAIEFHSVTATVKRVDYTDVVDDKSNSEGIMSLMRTKTGAVTLIQFKTPEPRSVHISDHTLQVYYPKANTVEIYDTAKFTSRVDQFLLLGFGTTAAELNRTYELKALGTEKVAGVAATRIELTPKSAEMKKLFTKIELWVPEGQDKPIQEKVTEPSKNYLQVTYSEMKVNPLLPASFFELRLPAGVKKVFPQK